MDTANYYGYKVAKGFRSVTVWVFLPSGKLLGTLKRTCGRSLTLEEKRKEVADFLDHYELVIHP